MKINYFNKGYSEGISDAKLGKSKDSRRELPKLKSLLPFVGSIIFKSYMKGYHIGYVNGAKQLKKEKEEMRKIRSRNQSKSNHILNSKTRNIPRRESGGRTWER